MRATTTAANSRTEYTAQTPEYANFDVPHTPVEPVASSSSSSFHARSHPTKNEGPPDDDDYQHHGHMALDEGKGKEDTDDDDDDDEYDYEATYSSYLRALIRRHRPGLSSKFRTAKEKTVELFKSNTGLLLVTGSQVFFSLMNVSVKKLNSIDPPVPTLELVAVRMIITYTCCMGYMLSTGVPDPFLGPKGVRLLLLTRGCVGFFGLFGVYYSLQYLSLSDATVLTFLAPMCTAIAGSLLLGEKFTKREAFAGIVSLIGVVLIARPAAIFGERSPVLEIILDDMDDESEIPLGDPMEKGTPKERLVAVGVALIGVLGVAGAYTSLRAIGKRAHAMHSMTFFSGLCVIIASTGMIINKTPVIVPTQLDWLALLIMIGIFGFAAQTLLTMGLQRETAGRGSMAVYTQIVFATILERIFFHAVPMVLSIIGTLLIISSALYVAFTKEKDANANPKSSIDMQQMSRDVELEEGLLASSLAASNEQELDEREGKGILESQEEIDGDDYGNGRKYVPPRVPRDNTGDDVRG